MRETSFLHVCRCDELFVRYAARSRLERGRVHTICYDMLRATALRQECTPGAYSDLLRPRRAHIPRARAHNAPPPPSHPGERGELLRADLAAAGFPSSLQPLIVLDALRAYRRPLARSALAGGMVDEPRGERAAGPRLEVLHAAPDARLPLLRRGRRGRRWCGCRLLRRTGDARPFVSARTGDYGNRSGVPRTSREQMTPRTTHLTKTERSLGAPQAAGRSR